MPLHSPSVDRSDGTPLGIMGASAPVQGTLGRAQDPNASAFIHAPNVMDPSAAGEDEPLDKDGTASEDTTRGSSATSFKGEEIGVGVVPVVSDSRGSVVAAPAPATPRRTPSAFSVFTRKSLLRFGNPTSEMEMKEPGTGTSKVGLVPSANSESLLSRSSSA